jgi:hypothetical protein
MNLPSDATVGGVNLLVATILLALAVLSKYFVEVSRDQLSRLGPGSYVYQERVAHSQKRRLASRVYRASFHARLLLAPLLLVSPIVAGIGLAVSLFAEMYVLFRYHLVLLTALSAMLVGVGMSIPGFPINFNLTAEYAVPVVPFVQLLLAAMYGLSAIRKWRNGFGNGRVLEHGVQISLSKRRFKEHALGSGWVLRTASTYLNWPLAAKVVIAGELSIGLLLASPSPTFNLIGVVVAGVAQASFTVLFPRTLLSFTLGVFAALVLWI